NQLRQTLLVFLAEDQLVGVRTAIRTHRHGFAATDQFGAAGSEPPPSPDNPIGHPASRCAVPTFHGLDGKTISDAFSVYANQFQRLRQRGISVSNYFVITRNLDAQCSQMGSEILGAFKRRNASYLL